MRKLIWIAIVSLLTLAASRPVAARVVRMESAVALVDHSGSSIEQAFRQAFDTAVAGARAMGLPTMRVGDARVLTNAVILLVVATDETIDDDDGEDVMDEDGLESFEGEATIAPLVL